MELMLVNLMEYFGFIKKLIFFLDSFYLEFFSFDYFYLVGIYINYGMYVIFYFFFVIMKRNVMKGVVVFVYLGLFIVLKDNGYWNLFFMMYEL